MDLLKGEPTLISVQHDFNQWYSDTQGAGWIVLQTILLICFSVNLFIGVKGLFSNIYHDGITPNPPQVTLFFNNVASIFLILSMVDPWNIRGILSGMFMEVTIILSLPAFLSGMATFAFYFNEVLIAKGVIEPKLKTLRIPFIIFCLYIWAIFLAYAILYATERITIGVAKASAFTATLGPGLILVYFAITGALLIKRLRVYNSRLLRRIYPLTIGVSLGCTISVAASIQLLVALYSPKDDARLNEGMWITYWIGGVIVIFPSVVMFRSVFPSTFSKIQIQSETLVFKKKKRNAISSQKSIVSTSKSEKKDMSGKISLNKEFEFSKKEIDQQQN